MNIVQRYFLTFGLSILLNVVIDGWFFFFHHGVALVIVRNLGLIISSRHVYSTSLVLYGFLMLHNVGLQCYITLLLPSVWILLFSIYHYFIFILYSHRKETSNVGTYMKSSSFAGTINKLTKYTRTHHRTFVQTSPQICMWSKFLSLRVRGAHVCIFLHRVFHSDYNTTRLWILDI